MINQFKSKLITEIAQPRLLCWAIVVLCVIGLGSVTGRHRVIVVPDSASYLDYQFGSLDAMFRNIRSPGYPAFLTLIRSTLGIDSLPIVQMFIHATASWVLMRELKAWGMSGRAMWLSGLAVAIACTAMDNEAIVSTDLLAASIGVLSVSSLMAWVRHECNVRYAVLPVILSVVAISIRPAYLALIPWTALAGASLCIYRNQSGPKLNLARQVAYCIIMSSAIATPILAWSVARTLVVDDFGILPFGHQNLAGLTVQFVTEDELMLVAKESNALANEIIASKRRYEDDGFKLANGDPRATMTIEARWDEYVWRIIVPAAAKLYPKAPIASHNAIKTLNREIITAYPWRYVRWLLLAFRRACWGTAANIVMHPVFLAMILFAVSILFAQTLGLLPPVASTNLDEPAIVHRYSATDALFIVAVTYFLCMVGLVILTSPPLGRFADAAAIFIPAWFAAKYAEMSSGPWKNR